MEHSEKGKILVSCQKGLSPYLKEELITLGYLVCLEDASYIETVGDLYDTMRLNLYLRTGQRVLYALVDFRAANKDDLYREMKKIRWEDHIYKDGYISVTSYVDTPSMKDSRYANLLCKDAVADRLREKYGQRPYSGHTKKGAVLFLHWKEERCSVYFDTSGEPLSKRNYRKTPLEAPMQETLASAVIMASGWDGKENFINPMCGSGTLAIEAALIALNRAPGLFRDNFGFMHLKGFHRAEWEQLREEAERESRDKLSGKIIATDISRKAIEAARSNAANAGVGHLIEFGVCDFRETPVPAGGGVVVLNPEYGERMGRSEELERVYKEVGDYFKQKCVGYKGFIFTGNLALAKKVGLRTKRRTQFFSGKIECRLLEYEIFQGSQKKKGLK